MPRRLMLGVVAACHRPWPRSLRSPNITYSPLGAIGVGPSGPASADIIVEPYCCPSGRRSWSTPDVVDKNDLEWVLLRLDGPGNREITRVSVCYAIDAGHRRAPPTSARRGSPT